MLSLVKLRNMEYSNSDYYFYSHLDPNREPIGTCRAGTLGIATYYFASMKGMNTESFLKLYSISIKNESK
jgi:hypothetical protein